MTVTSSQQSTENGSTHPLNSDAVRQLIDYCSRTPSSTTLPPHIHTPHRENSSNLDSTKFYALILKTLVLVIFFSLIRRDSRHRSPAIAPRIGRDSRFGAREC